MCECEAHQTNLTKCECMCEDHDNNFEPSVVIVRKAVRAQAKQIYDLQHDMGQAMNAIGKGENKDVEPETLTGVVAPPPKMPRVVKLCHLPRSPMVIGSTCADCGHASLAHSDYGPCATCVMGANVHANTR